MLCPRGFVSCCPAYVEVLRQTELPSSDSYHFSARFIVSEVNFVRRSRDQIRTEAQEEEEECKFHTINGMYIGPFSFCYVSFVRKY
jgi:hypothetical protein